MPTILSKELKAKLLGSDWSFGYNCYEVGHTWTPNCTDAALEVSLAAGLNILPLYALLYTFSQVAVQRKYDLPASLDTVKSTLRSSFFIFFHAYNGSLLGCALRNGFGRFYYRLLVYGPAIFSSYLSLLIEKPSRRQALAFYLLNLASEILYRMAVTKGYFKPIKYGETLLFSVSLALWYHLIKEHGFGHDPVSAAVKILIGRDEGKRRIRPQEEVKETKRTLEQLSLENGKEYDKSIRSKYEAILRKFMPQVTKHSCCPHKEINCAEYILSPIPTRFLLGCVVNSLLILSKKPLQLLKSPSNSLYKAFISAGSVRFGLFLVFLVSIGRLTSCSLRHLRDRDEKWHSYIAGFTAGLSMLWAPRSSISMYIMWKAVEQYYLLAAKRGQVKYFHFTTLSIYSVSAATILYTFALEPKLMRPSYMKFLDNLSDHRLHQLNRMVLDVFGTGSSIGYEDYFPDLDPKYMSNQFKELIFNWMIQPYE